MDTNDYEAHADYWSRQADLHPEDYEAVMNRVLAVAELIVQQAAVDYLNEPGS